MIRLKMARPKHIWLVVSTPVKNINQLGGLFPTYGKMKNVPNHQPDRIYTKKKSIENTTLVGTPYSIYISLLQDDIHVPPFTYSM